MYERESFARGAAAAGHKCASFLARLHASCSMQGGIDKAANAMCTSNHCWLPPTRATATAITTATMTLFPLLCTYRGNANVSSLLMSQLESSGLDSNVVLPSTGGPGGRETHCHG